MLPAGAARLSTNTPIAAFALAWERSLNVVEGVLANGAAWRTGPALPSANVVGRAALIDAWVRPFARRVVSRLARADDDSGMTGCCADAVGLVVGVPLQAGVVGSSPFCNVLT